MRASLWFVCFLLIAVIGLRAAPEGPAPVEKPMRMVFKAYDGDPKDTDHYEKFSFQIDTVDLHQPSEFLRLGDLIPNTKFKLVKFVYKEAFDEKRKENVDVSELVIVNTVTGQTATLRYNMVVDVSAYGK
jgi:hypothetical protein